MINSIVKPFSRVRYGKLRLRLHNSVLILALLFSLIATTSVPSVYAAPIATNEPPIAPHSLIAFSQRDFVSVSGYAETETVTIEIIHSAIFGGGIVTAGPGLVPVDDPSTPEFDGIVEVNHPGGYCWNGVTPDIRPGDKLRVTVDQTNVADQTTVANVVSKRAVQTGPNTVQIHGTAQDVNGNPIPADQLEQRLVSPGNLFDFNNRRTLRAVAAPATSDGVLEYDPISIDNPAGIKWTATYDNLLPDDVTRALEAEARIHWLGANPAAGVEATIFEIGAGITAGPAAPCTAPGEILPPPPGSELIPPSVPQNVIANTNGTPNTVTLTWDASTDNVGVTSYGIYRNGAVIANVQNPDGTAPAPTTYVDFNVPAGTYDYTIDAADEVGNRSVQSAPPANAITIGQVAIGVANEPPAGGRAILTFPSRDFISAEGYLPDEQVTVQVIRNGFVVSSVDGMSPVDGIVEVNHPGGACWAGVTPELRAGDIVRTIAYAPDLSIRSVDQVTVANVTANKAVVTAPGTVQIYGTAQDADGNPLPIDQLEQRLVGASRDPFNLNSRRALRAPGDGTISYDTIDNPTGTKWTAIYTGLDAHDVQLALDVESRVLWLGRDPLAGVEITLFEVGLLDPPGPSPAFCTSPLEAADVTAPSTPSLSATPNGAARTVQLDWTASTDDTAIYGYLITRDGQPLRYVGANTISYLDQGVNPGPHIYTVQAFDSASARGAGLSIVEQIASGLGQRYGNLSGFAAPVSVILPDVTAPSIPGDLTALSGVDSVTLNWSASTDDVGVTEYGVYRDSVLIAAINGTSYTDSGLAIGTYSYSIDAADASGNRSAQTSAVIANITPAPDIEAPSVPADVVASVPDVRARNIVISWSASTDNIAVTGYTLYRNGVAIATLNGSTLSYADINLPASTNSYTVDAVDSAGNRSAQSAGSSAAVANDPPLAPHSIIPFPARDFVSSDGYLGEGPVVVSVLRNGIEVYLSDSVLPDDVTGLAEINHPGPSGACWAVSTPDIRPGDIIRVTNAAGVPDQTVVTGVTAERPIQVNANTVVVHGVAVDENGIRLPIGQIESRLVVGTAASFDINGRRLLRADSGGTGDGILVYDGSTANWTATYTGLTAADVTKALAAESISLWLGRTPLIGNESTIFENGPGTDGGPSAGFCISPAEPNRPQASFAPTSVNFGNQSAVPATTSALRNITLNNVSTATMTINKIYFAGANPADFAMVGNTCGATLAAGANCTVSVTFSPTALGARSANLSFMDDAANTSFQTVPLTGTGTDSSAPSAPGLPNQALANGSLVSITSIPVTVSWTASATGVVDHYELQRSINNGAFANVALPIPTSTSVVVSLTPGTSNSFRVRACNITNNCSAYSTGTTLANTATQENVKAVSVSGTWTNQVVAGAFGGSVRFASTNRDKAQFKFTGSSVSFVSTVGPNRGRISISIDGGAAQTIDLYAPVQQTGKVVFSVSGLAAGRSHQIVVQVLGNRNPLSTANRADVDGFITMR